MSGISPNIAWGADSKTLLYVVNNKELRPQWMKAHVLGTSSSTDPLIFDAKKSYVFQLDSAHDGQRQSSSAWTDSASSPRSGGVLQWKPRQNLRSYYRASPDISTMSITPTAAGTSGPTRKHPTTSWSGSGTRSALKADPLARPGARQQIHAHRRCKGLRRLSCRGGAVRGEQAHPPLGPERRCHGSHTRRPGVHHGAGP